LGFEVRGELEFAEAGQVLGGGQQGRLDPLGTEVVHAFPDDGHRLFDCQSIVPASTVHASGVLQGVLVEEPDQALAMKLGHEGHLGQQPAFLGSIRGEIAGSQLLQVLASYVDGHLVVGRQGALPSVTSGSEGTVLGSLTFQVTEHAARHRKPCVY
jgi:hypothetical protein